MGDLGYVSGLVNVLIANRYRRGQEQGSKNKLLQEEGRKEQEGKQNMKDIQEQIVGLGVWQKSSDIVIVNRKTVIAG